MIRLKDLLNEQNFKDELISQGYKDITNWFLGPDGVVYIPDGEYTGIGDENYIRIKTPEGVDTGYVLFWEEPMNTRGGTPTDVKIKNNGFTILVNGKFNSIMLNQNTLDKSGLKKQ
jgi:hypothetical protein